MFLVLGFASAPPSAKPRVSVCVFFTLPPFVALRFIINKGQTSERGSWFSGLLLRPGIILRSGHPGQDCVCRLVSVAVSVAPPFLVHKRRNERIVEPRSQSVVGAAEGLPPPPPPPPLSAPVQMMLVKKKQTCDKYMNTAMMFS